LPNEFLVLADFWGLTFASVNFVTSLEKLVCMLHDTVVPVKEQYTEKQHGHYQEDDRRIERHFGVVMRSNAEYSNAKTE
jgi:hypothetical protein